MNTIEFKKMFGELAISHGFEAAYGGWFIESAECIAVLDLQKSNYANYFYLNLKLYIQGAFGKSYRKEKNLVKNDTGDIFTREATEYSPLLDLDNTQDKETRINGLNEMFINFINPIMAQVLSKRGIKQMFDTNKLFILPAVLKELDKLMKV